MDVKDRHFSGVLSSRLFGQSSLGGLMMKKVKQISQHMIEEGVNLKKILEK